MGRLTPLAGLLLAAGLPAAGASGVPALPCAPAPTISDRCPAWVADYDYPGGRAYDGEQEGRALAVGPAGDRVYVTGAVLDDETGSDFGTVALDAATGVLAWSARHDGPTHQGDGGWDVAVSPDGRRVYVVGNETIDLDELTTEGDLTTIAYDAATGEELWAARYDGPAGGDDRARAVIVSPDGDRIYVAGFSATAAGDVGTVLVAYDAADGEEAWVSRHEAEPGRGARLLQIALSPDGSRVYLAGEEGIQGAGTDLAVAAFDALDGEALWDARYDGPTSEDDAALAIVANTEAVFAAGESDGETGVDYATVAFASHDGSRLWAARYDGGLTGWDEARGIALAPGSDRVYVTGRSSGYERRLPQGIDLVGMDVATLAYDAATGAQLWAARYDGPRQRFEAGRDIAVSPDGSRVYVAGLSAREATNDPPSSQCIGCQSSIVTLGYEAATGAPAWVGRFNPTAELDSGTPSDLELSPDGQRVFVTGTFVHEWDIAPELVDGFTGTGLANASDYWTLAYDR